MTSLITLSDHHIVDLLNLAVEKKVDEGFIQLLRNELERRGVKIG